MKVRAIKKGYYEGRIIKIGEVFECKDKQLPSWVEKIKGDKKQETKIPETKQNPDGNGEKQNDGQNGEQVKKPEQVINPDDNGENDSQKEGDKTPDEQTLTETEKEQHLELLLNEAMDKNILIEDADKKSVDEQIAELEAKLGKGK